MNIKCQDCIKEKVCKFKEQYEKDVERLNEEQYCEVTSVKISCKEFDSKHTPMIRGLAVDEDEDEEDCEETDDSCPYYDSARMRCNGAKCTPECYCYGHKSQCTEYPDTRAFWRVLMGITNER